MCKSLWYGHVCFVNVTILTLRPPYFNYCTSMGKPMASCFLTQNKAKQKLQIGAHEKPCNNHAHTEYGCLLSISVEGTGPPTGPWAWLHNLFMTKTTLCR